MNAQILGVLLKALEHSPQGVLAILQLVLDLLKNNPAVLAELVGSLKAKS